MIVDSILLLYEVPNMIVSGYNTVKSLYDIYVIYDRYKSRKRLHPQ